MKPSFGEPRGEVVVGRVVAGRACRAAGRCGRAGRPPPAAARPASGPSARPARPRRRPPARRPAPRRTRSSVGLRDLPRARIGRQRTARRNGPCLPCENVRETRRAASINCAAECTGCDFCVLQRQSASSGITAYRKNRSRTCSDARTSDCTCCSELPHGLRVPLRGSKPATAIDRHRPGQWPRSIPHRAAGANSRRASAEPGPTGWPSVAADQRRTRESGQLRNSLELRLHAFGRRASSSRPCDP